MQTGLQNLAPYGQNKTVYYASNGQMQFGQQVYQVVGGNFTNEPYGIAVDKGQTQMMKKIDKALDELKADGTYDKLIQKWFGNVKGFDAKGAGER